MQDAAHSELIRIAPRRNSYRLPSARAGASLRGQELSHTVEERIMKNTSKDGGSIKSELKRVVSHMAGSDRSDYLDRSVFTPSPSTPRSTAREEFSGINASLSVEDKFFRYIPDLVCLSH